VAACPARASLPRPRREISGNRGLGRQRQTELAEVLPACAARAARSAGRPMAGTARTVARNPARHEPVHRPPPGGRRGRALCLPLTVEETCRSGQGEAPVRARRADRRRGTAAARPWTHRRVPDRSRPTVARAADRREDQQKLVAARELCAGRSRAGDRRAADPGSRRGRARRVHGACARPRAAASGCCSFPRPGRAARRRGPDPGALRRTRRGRGAAPASDESLGRPCWARPMTLRDRLSGPRANRLGGSLAWWPRSPCRSSSSPPSEDARWASPICSKARWATRTVENSRQVGRLILTALSSPSRSRSGSSTGGEGQLIWGALAAAVVGRAARLPAPPSFRRRCRRGGGGARGLLAGSSRSPGATKSSRRSAQLIASTGARLAGSRTPPRADPAARSAWRNEPSARPPGSRGCSLDRAWIRPSHRARLRGREPGSCYAHAAASSARGRRRGRRRGASGIPIRRRVAKRWRSRSRFRDSRAPARLGDRAPLFRASSARVWIRRLAVR